MMRGDTRALFTIRSQASAVPLGTSTWFHENSGRFVMKRMQFTAAALIAGQANEFDIYGNVRFNQYPALLYAEGLSKGPTKLTQTDNRITSQNFAVDGVTGLKVHVSFMAAMYIEGWRFLLDQLPASTNKTNMIAQMIASLTALEANAALSTGNTAGYIYQDIPSWLNTRTDTVLAAPYTSGTTVQISGPTSMINIVLPVGSGVTIAGVTRVTTANVTFDGTGLGTVVVNSGFPAGAASGTSINLALAAEAGGGPGLPDLAGFHPHILAWKATKTGNVADANRARTVYATLGAVPQDGGTGPSILGNKQYEEAFWRSPLTLAYLQQSGL